MCRIPDRKHALVRCVQPISGKFKKAIEEKKKNNNQFNTYLIGISSLSLFFVCVSFSLLSLLRTNKPNQKGKEKKKNLKIFEH